MADTLKARIVNKYHSHRLEIGGGARETLVVQAVIDVGDPVRRQIGPLEKVFDRNATTYEIDAWLETERQALDGKV